MLPKFTSSLLSQIPHIAHGFYTKNGDGSTCLSVSSNESPHKAQENLNSIKQDLGFSDIIINKQTHSTDVYELKTPTVPKQPGDGLVTRQPDILCAVRTADCMPVLFAHPQMTLVAAVHAGWKGLLKGVLEEAVSYIGQYTNPAELYCAIGPCMAQKNFEVGNDVFSQTASGMDQFFMGKAPGKWFFDMAGYAIKILYDTGIKHIDHIKEDTYSQPEKLFSFRRSQHLGIPEGTQASVIGIKHAFEMRAQTLYTL